MPELFLADEVYEVIGAAMEVFYQLGRGFQEQFIRKLWR